MKLLKKILNASFFLLPGTKGPGWPTPYFSAGKSDNYPILGWIYLLPEIFLLVFSLPGAKAPGWFIEILIGDNAKVYCV